MNNVLIKRIKALFLVAMAIAVALNLILTPVYHDGSPDYPVWEIMNWFMAAAVLVALNRQHHAKEVPQQRDNKPLSTICGPASPTMGPSR